MRRLFPSSISSAALLVAVVTICTVSLRAWQGSPRPPQYAFAEPGISPDGREIAFSSGGGIWTVPAAGGDARLLVADGAHDRRPLYSPDGKSAGVRLVAIRRRRHVRVTFATGALKRLTWDDGLDQLDGWSRDSALDLFLRRRAATSRG